MPESGTEDPEETGSVFPPACPGEVVRVASKVAISDPVALKTMVSVSIPLKSDKNPAAELLKGAVVRLPDEVNPTPFAEVEKLALPRDWVPEIPVVTIPVEGPRPDSENVIVKVFPPAFAPAALNPSTEIKFMAGAVVLPISGTEKPAVKFKVQLPTAPTKVISPGVVVDATPVAVSPAPSVKVNVSVARADATATSANAIAEAVILEILFIIRAPLKHRSCQHA